MTECPIHVEAALSLDLVRCDHLGHVWVAQYLEPDPPWPTWHVVAYGVNRDAVLTGHFADQMKADEAYERGVAQLPKEAMR